MDRTRRIFVVILAVAVCILLIAIVWPPTPPLPPPPTELVTRPPTSTIPASGSVVISFWTNDTKADWVNAVTERFNAGDHRTAAGQKVVVEVQQLSSGDVFPKIVAGEIQPTVWSPGEMVWVADANIEWTDLNGRPLVSGECKPLVYTAIGFGMWRPMAEALGWPDTPIGWEEIVALAADPTGWVRHGLPEWGQFRFGHTDPSSSNTGLLAMTSLAYAAAGVTENLTPEMVRSDRVVDAFRQVELHTDHYGLSTRSMFEAMARRGPSYLHAGTNSEIGVLATNYFQEEFLRYPLVFVYPKEGSFWSDNPYCVLDADWVTDEQRAAAEVYKEYLLGREAQEMAIDEWLRPADTAIALRSPIDLEHGANPAITPQSVVSLPSVSGETATAIQDVFLQTKKKATIVILLDMSQSMEGEKLTRMLTATRNFIDLLARDDEVVIHIFNDAVTRLEPSGRAGDVVESLGGRLDNLFVEGNTALYDAICAGTEAIAALQAEDQAAGEQRLYGIVLLSDGQDTNSVRTESEMFECLPESEAVTGPKIYAIAYGEDADKALLQRIANRSNGQFYEGGPDEIEVIYQEISFEQ